MFKRTKIVATIGPATVEREIMELIIQEGVDVIRINFSHGTYADHKKAISNIAKINEEQGSSVSTLADLQGPKIRIGKIKDNKVTLEDGNEILIITDEVLGDEKVISTNYSNFPKDVKPEERVLLDDGRLAFEVLETNGKNKVKCRIIHGGVLSSNKGINLPNTKISLPCLTEKDLKDLDFALENEVDWIGLSFVRSARDIIELKHIITSKEKSAKIIAKIEKPEAIEDIDEIIIHADAIMVARGDLGVEIPMENIPLIQKMLIQKSRKASKPVIVATQMMESMISSITPTRAEVNDVANAVLDGTDAVMLSAETSVGKYPVEVIKSMTKIINVIEEKEDNLYYDLNQEPGNISDHRFVTDAICFNAVRLAKRSQASAIATMTFSGYTGRKISSLRPKSCVFVFTGNKKILTMMNLVWGVKALYYDKMVSTDHTIADIKYILKKEGYLLEDDFIINVASMPITDQGMSNMLKLSRVE